jgi:hypothetical protein
MDGHRATLQETLSYVRSMAAEKQAKRYRYDAMCTGHSFRVENRDAIDTAARVF